jgi:hypothetical protein
VVIDGKPYTVAVQFFASAESQEFPGEFLQDIQIATVISIGSGRYRIGCARGPVENSVTKAIGLGNVYEDTWTTMCGGNVVTPEEPFRLYSYNSDLAFRGDRRNNRVEAGDIIAVGPESARQYLFVESARAMNVRPSVVDWRPGVQLPLIRRL